MKPPPAAGTIFDITIMSPRGFRLKTSIAGGQQYWPEVWATPALAAAAAAQVQVWRRRGVNSWGMERPGWDGCRAGGPLKSAMWIGGSEVKP